MKPLFQQIWQGDSAEMCAKFKQGSVDCIITDPPFGVDNQSNMAVTKHGKDYARKIANDESPEKAIAVFKQVMSVLLPKTAENCDAYVFTSYQVLKEWLVMLDDFMGIYGFNRKAIIVWEKDGPGMGDLDVTWGMGCEFIPFYRKGRRDKSSQRRNAVLHYPQVRPDKLIHPHEKPLPLLEHLAQASTSKRDFVVDPFGGSSSLARAMRRIDRSCVTIELDKKNADLALKAFNEGDGAGFDFD
jgi:adenine-specific DNA-methyltransferase